MRFWSPYKRGGGFKSLEIWGRLETWMFQVPSLKSLTNNKKRNLNSQISSSIPFFFTKQPLTLLKVTNWRMSHLIRIIIIWFGSLSLKFTQHKDSSTQYLKVSCLTNHASWTINFKNWRQNNQDQDDWWPLIQLLP